MDQITFSKWVCVMSHCTIHSFEIICRGWKLGLADHMMRSFYEIAQLFDTMYQISSICDIMRQGVDSLAQWLQHWIYTPAVRVRIPSGTWDFFQTMHHRLFTNFHIRKK